MIPYAQTFTHWRGDYFEDFFRIRGRVWNPALNEGAGGWEAGAYRDLTGWTGLFQVRPTADSTTVWEGVVTFTDQVAVPGGVNLAIESSVTAAMAVGTNKYDVQLIDELSKPRTYKAGDFIVLGDVSRAP